MKNGKLKIEKGLPIPSYHCGPTPSPEALVMQKMVKGDSVLLHKRRGAANQLAARILGRGHYTLREVDGGFRVWRTK